MIFEKHRFEIWGPGQHPYKHSVSEFSYTHNALPGITNVESALNWVLAVLYPNSLGSVANVAALPAVGNTINDYRVVLDDGDGKAASYRWEQREGDVAAKWYKIYDVDWGVDSVLEQFYLKTQDVYASKRGYDDRDSNGNLITGVLAGQSIYGGATANSSLSLFANSGDGTSSNTGFVQVGDHFRPISDNTLDLGTSALKFRNLHVGTTGNFGTSVIAGTLTVAGGSITDSSGAIDFGNENLGTTGTLSSGTHTIGNLVLATGSITHASGTVSFSSNSLSTSGTIASGNHTIGTLTLAAASISDSSGALSFGTTNLGTTGTLTAGNSTFTQVNADNLRLDGNTFSSTNANGNIVITANGSGVVDITSAMATIGQTITGTLTVNGQLNADNLRLDGNTLSSSDTNGNIILDPNGTGLIELGASLFPSSHAVWDIGKSGNVWSNLWINGNLKDGTNTLAIATLMSFRDALVGASSGMTLFYDGSKWNASLPDTEVDHGTISGLGDDDHTQYALLAGRSSGQSLIGGTASGENLNLESTSHATKGSILLKSNAAPFTNAAYSGGWTGTDLGDSSHNFRDVYTKGVHKGFRLEGFLAASIPAFSSQNTGRLTFATDTKKIYLDTGAAQIVASVSRFVADQSFDGSTTLKDVDVSAYITDARNCIIQLLDNSNDFERIFCSLKATSATNVRINCTPALPAGSYRLIVLE